MIFRYRQTDRHSSKQKKFSKKNFKKNFQKKNFKKKFFQKKISKKIKKKNQKKIKKKKDFQKKKFQKKISKKSDDFSLQTNRQTLIIIYISSLGHLLGDCLQLASENVHHHVERVERKPRSEEDHTHLVTKTMNLVFQHIRHTNMLQKISGTQKGNYSRRLTADSFDASEPISEPAYNEKIKAVAIAHHELNIYLHL